MKNRVQQIIIKPDCISFVRHFEDNVYEKNERNVHRVLWLEHAKIVTVYRDGDKFTVIYPIRRDYDKVQ